jgi:hypothetical protein
MNLIFNKVIIGEMSLLLAMFLIISIDAKAQTVNDASNKTEWLKELYEEGISKNGDSIRISDEVIKLYNNSSYRDLLYPTSYDWPSTLGFMQKNELKKAFWFLINLYDQKEENKPLVLKALVAYNASLDMNKILTNTFYTYCYADPLVSKIVDNSPEIHSPHILEAKLMILKELLFFLDKYKTESEKILQGLEKLE